MKTLPPVPSQLIGTRNKLAPEPCVLPDPLRILMTADTVGGVWSYALDLARALTPYGISVTLAAMGPPLSPYRQSEVEAITNLTVHARNYKLEWMDDPWDEVQAAGQWLLELEDATHPDIIHLNGYAHGSLPFHAPILMAAHSCVCSWMRAVRGSEAGSEWSRYRKAVQQGLGHAALVAAPTQAMLSALEDHYEPLPNSQVISNGRDARQFQPAHKEPLILTAGRVWDEAKNIGALNAIADQLAWPVYAAGEAQHPSGGTTSLTALRMLGSLPPRELGCWFARAAIYALPARYEPFGLSVLEAALSGCALVLGDIPSLREVWGEAALFVAPDNPAALRTAIKTLMESTSLRREMAERALRRAGYFTLERMAEGYVDAYTALRPISSGGQSRPERRDRACGS